MKETQIDNLDITTRSRAHVALVILGILLISCAYVRLKVAILGHHDLSDCLSLLVITMPRLPSNGYCQARVRDGRAVRSSLLTRQDSLCTT